MPYVKIKTKGQVTIPAEFRRDLNLKEGDLLEALVERGGILLKPKTVVDRYDEKWAKNLLKEAQEEAKRNPKTREEEDAEERRFLELLGGFAQRLFPINQIDDVANHMIHPRSRVFAFRGFLKTMDQVSTPFCCPQQDTIT
jgi:AbrB family looped-hinge helix DNA binding protein